MTGREFLELDSPQQRLFLERLKWMETVEKMLNQLPKADQTKLLARQTAGSNTGPPHTGQLNCEVCAVVRGGLVGAVIGALYPVCLAIPLNASLAARYMSSPLPGKENALRYWLTIAQPVFRKMSLGVLVQVLTGLYLATKHHGIYVKILQQMNISRDPEELQD
ncbi:Transmembrane protein 126A [Willisornis vidua]|uniref:Transmembrane protein 126A n=1 Tax=Willisornis vidua TaxID=1566151 RepID=A0ABQ9CN65_9PASS|nr:Transmembrane protein 126A [Willisornis vidua]